MQEAHIWIRQLAEQARVRAEQQARARRAVYEFVDAPGVHSVHSAPCQSTASFIEMYGLEMMPVVMPTAPDAFEAPDVPGPVSIPMVSIRPGVCLTPRQVCERLAG